MGKSVLSVSFYVMCLSNKREGKGEGEEKEREMEGAYMVPTSSTLSSSSCASTGASIFSTMNSSPFVNLY